MTEGELAAVRECFRRYAASFYTGNAADDRNYALKEEHTLQVAENAAIVAESAGLDAGGVRLAAAVGLCHDLGRFPQYRDYRTFRDADSVNHAALSAKVVVEEKVLDRLDERERTVAVRAVANHNVFALPDLPDRESFLHARIIRDADKLDIWRVFINEFSTPESERASAAPLGFPDTGSCSPEALAELERGRMLRLQTVRTLDDFRLLQLSWIYDLNFPVSLRLFQDRGVLASFAPHLPSDPAVASSLARLERYVEERLASAEIVFRPALC